MGENSKDYFKDALSDFAFDMACGSQIRHLADLGYTVNQIMGELDISIPFLKVQKTVTEHLQASGVLTVGRPDGKSIGKKEFVREYDRYGKPSFRQVKAKPSAGICWQERVYLPSADGDLSLFLNSKTEENGEDNSYVSCDFGLNPEKTAKATAILEPRQKDYIEGVLWETKRIYHRLSPIMRAIISKLYAQGLYEGECYFKQSGEHIIVPGHPY